MKVASPSGGSFGSAHAPGAARGGRHQPDGQRASAQTLVGNDGAAVFDAVRPLDHQGQRYVDHGHALAVAQQRCDLHGFSRAVDAALRIDKSVEPGGDRAAGDAAVGQIEGRRFETQEGVIAVAVACDQHGRRQRALAARQIGFEMHVTGVGGACERTSLLRESSRTSTAPLAWVVSSECTNAWMPSLPENAVSPRSETMNHWVATESNSSLSAPAGVRGST